MTKQQIFDRKVKELVRRADNLTGQEVKKVIRLLVEARKAVAATVAQTDWQAYYLPQMQAAIDRALQEFGQRYGVNMRYAQSSLWEEGIALVDLPLRAAGVTAAFPAIDTTALGIMQGYGADLVKGLARDAALRINNELTLGLMGQKTPYEVMKAVGRNLKDPSVFKSIAARAETITRTECARVLHAASQARMEKAATVVPGLKKKWLHGKAPRKMPRLTHLAADGQVKDIDKPFLVGGEALMYPVDPAGSARNTINCGCYTASHHPDWDAAA